MLHLIIEVWVHGYSGVTFISLLPCQIINFCQYIYYIVAFATAQVTEKKQGVSVCWAKFGGPAGASDPELFIVQESLYDRLKDIGRIPLFMLHFCVLYH